MSAGEQGDDTPHREQVPPSKPGWSGSGRDGGLLREFERKRAQQAAHTPGPWRVNIYEDGRGKHRSVVRDTRGMPEVAHVSAASIRAELADANARLIAAAPDLLEALKAVARAEDATDRRFVNLRLLREAMPKVRDAIAKARP